MTIIAAPVSLDTAAQSISIYGKISAITFILLEKPDVLFDKH